MDFLLGYDEAGSGDALVLVHGFPLDRTMWKHQLEGLSEIRRVIAPDLRGRGKSPFEDPDGSTVDDYAEDIARTLASIGISKADIAGLSMGGYVVFALWRAHPELFRSMILIDTKASADSPEAKEGREKTAALVREKGTAELVNILFDKMFAPGTSDEARNLTRKMFENTPSETAAADALMMRDRPDSTPDLQSIKVPALVIHGQQDALFPTEIARDMASQLLDAKLSLVDNAGHMAPLENPTAVNSAIRNFLK